MIARLVTLAALTGVLVTALLLPGAGLAGPLMQKPAIEIKAGTLGKVIATPKRLGIYYWDVEKRAGGKIRCTGKCAVEWPPVFVKGSVPRHVNGVMATLGTIKRGAKRQLTVNGLPAYTYRGDTANVVLCDGVDGWHVVRPSGG